MFDAICVIALIAYFLHFALPAVGGRLNDDEMMNLMVYWSAGALKSLWANVCFWTPFYRPGGALYYLPLYHFFALNPQPYRIVQISILTVSIPMVYYLSRCLASSRSVAFLAVLALCYHAELITLVFIGSFIYDVLCGFFYFAALTYYIHIREGGASLRPLQLFGFLALYVCALDFKEMAVTLPVIVLLYEVLKCPRWVGWKQFVRWSRSSAAPALIAGLLTALYIYGKTHGPGSLINLDPYRPRYSWSTFLTCNAQFVSQLLYRFPDHVISHKALLVLWGFIFIYAFLRRDRTLRLMAFWIVIVPLPIAFLPQIRGGGCLYLLLFGWAMIFAKIASDLITLISKSLMLIKVPPLICRVVAMLIVAFSLALLTQWENQRFGRVRAFLNSGQKTSHVIQAFRSLNLHPAPGSTILLLLRENPFQNKWNPFFIASLVWNDHSLRIWLEGKQQLKPEQLAKVDYVVSLDEFEAKVIRAPHIIRSD
jgi:hypothetical protein